MENITNSRGEVSGRSPYTKEPYGFCNVCETPLEVSEWFDEPEFNKQGIPTGRYRRAANSLTCPCCMKNFCIDDSFDERYFHAKKVVHV